MAQNGLALSVAAMSLFWGATVSGDWRPEPAAFALFLLAPTLIIAYWRAAAAFRKGHTDPVADQAESNLPPTSVKPE